MDGVEFIHVTEKMYSKEIWIVSSVFRYNPSL